MSLTIGARVPLYFASSETMIPKRRTCTVIGFFTTGFSNYDDTYVLGNLDVVRSLMGWESTQAGALELFFKR